MDTNNKTREQTSLWPVLLIKRPTELFTIQQASASLWQLYTVLHGAKGTLYWAPTYHYMIRV